MDYLQQFVKLSKYAGERFDLVQAGGGNTSVQLSDGMMLVKASGCLLSEVSTSKGHVRVARKLVLDLLERGVSAEDACAALLPIVEPQGARPSIEIYFHAMLNKFTLHAHPVVVNSIVCREGWQDVIRDLFPTALMVGYHTPGIKVAIALKEELSRTGWTSAKGSAVVFLQNHGLIVSADTLEQVLALNEDVVLKIERFLGCDMARYKLSNRISAIVNQRGSEQLIAYRSEDLQIARLLKENRVEFFKASFFPDGAVFFGAGAVELQSLGDSHSVRAYYQKYGGHPVVLIFKDDIFFVAANVRKAREIEEIFKVHVMASCFGQGRVLSLAADELSFLGHWDAEIYRQNL